jgi:acyl-CoA synthetase (NDP forming)
VTSDSGRDQSAALGGTPAVALLRSAAASGRAALDDGELSGLLAELGVSTATGAAAQDGSAALRIGIERSREFGMVISAGPGGIDAELAGAGSGRQADGVYAAAALAGGDDFLALTRRTLAYRRMALRSGPAASAALDKALAACFAALLEIARAGEQTSTAQAARALASLSFDATWDGQRLVALDASAALGDLPPARHPRPIEKIDRLLHPRSIGIIGVSAGGMNFGRIILRNLMGSGYQRERLTIIRAGETEIDGVRCVASLRALPGKLDLLIVAVAADAVYALVDEIIATDSVEAVMLIPGSLGETRKSREPAAALAQRINDAHAGGAGPVFLGANCLGVVSHPGSYDSWFIPLERLPKPSKKAERNSVMLSQSGAFMITRISQNPWLDPRYMLALGNQTDLTHGDFLRYFCERPEIETIGIYVEGFRDLDGLDFVRAVRAAVRAGKQVVVYKAGRTAAGAGSVMGHTASVAGDPTCFDSVVSHAGAIVARDLSDFDDLFHIAGDLHAKRIGGARLGAISGAGFEAVAMADSIATEGLELTMGTLAPATVAKVEEVLAARRLDALVEVRNPIDINPGADDEAHLLIVEAFLDDPEIDAVVVGLDPTAPSVRALAESKLRPGYDISDPKSTVNLMPALVARHDKPVIGVVDGGDLYDTMAGALMDRGVCVFRNSARATSALARYVAARLQADAIRDR